LVVDDVKGSDHMFYAQLIDAKDSKLSGKGSYVRTGVGSGELPRVSSALAQQLNGSGRRRSAPAPVRNYPAELDIEMVFVEGGAFQMGCTGSTCYSADASPSHTVTVKSFSIGRYEVTRAQWKAVIPSSHPLYNAGNNSSDDQLPIENMSWLEIDTAFLPRLNALTGKKYRLPTEAEWEYAARGCKAGVCENYTYSGSNNVSDVAWYGGIASTHPVGQKKPNGLGIYDMSGNVWEWCKDWYSASYYASSPSANPENTTASTARVRRGGGWNGDITWSCVSTRYSNTPNGRSVGTGLRVVLPAQ
jgi:formylglycine-generating enzyme required for sulfatase activity